MSSCIICGADVDGRVCDLHEEDVVFEFTGTEPDQLTPNRYYRGTVDGYADFGIFVDIGDHVTGLLHKSELDRRLDSVDLDPGDTVYVQVQGVRDNGNVDLGWSIRQDESRFRGALVEDPAADEERLPDEEQDDASGAVRTDGTEEGNGNSRAASSEEAPGASTPDGDASDDSTPPETAIEPTEATSKASETGPEPSETANPPETAEPTEATVGELEDLVGTLVRLEGEIASVRQTSGPTVFELRDETGRVECAAFVEAGVRAYPSVEEGEIVRIEGEVERRRGELQVETEALVVLEEAERAAVTDRMEAALAEQARPESVELLAEDPAIEPVEDGIRDAATAIRRAIIEGRPVVVRHAATVDGYVASAAIERATLPLIRDEHQAGDAEYHFFERRPIEGAVYDMNDATRDVDQMLTNQERHDEQFPLFVFVAAGSTESIDGFDLLDVYGARRVVVDDRPVESTVASAVDVAVGPDTETTATVVGVNVAANVNPDVRPDLGHLPAVSFWDQPLAAYDTLATEQGYDAAETRKLREAVALESFYQSYEDKRELVIDLLFTEEADIDLAEQISEQYRTRMDDAIETAEANLKRHVSDDQTVLVLDTEAYTHRYEFPPETLLLDELYRRHREEASALVGVGKDEAHIRSDADIDVESIVDAATTVAPAAALDARGAREGRVEFLAGERGAAHDGLVEALRTSLQTV